MILFHVYCPLRFFDAFMSQKILPFLLDVAQLCARTHIVKTEIPFVQRRVIQDWKVVGQDVAAALGAVYAFHLLFSPRCQPDLLDDGAVVVVLLGKIAEDVNHCWLLIYVLLLLLRLWLLFVGVSVPMSLFLQHFVSFYNHMDVPAEEQRQPGESHVDPQLGKYPVEPRVFYIWIYTWKESRCSGMHFHN